MHPDSEKFRARPRADGLVDWNYQLVHRLRSHTGGVGRLRPADRWRLFDTVTSNPMISSAAANAHMVIIEVRAEV